jgi:hypothetical protein
MARWKMIVQLDPVEGREQEFLEYYPKVHVNDVAQTPGVVGAEFLHRGLIVSDKGTFPWDYMVIYDIECDDPQEVLALITARMKSGEIRADGTLLRAERRTCFYAPVSVAAG